MNLRTAVIIGIIVLLSSHLAASPIDGPTHTNITVKVPDDGYDDFHLRIDVTDGEPTVRNATGADANGAPPTITSPTTHTVEDENMPTVWDYTWSTNGFFVARGDTWKLGIELNHDNTMKILLAFWTKGGVPQTAAKDKVAAPQWEVVGRDTPLGQDPLEYSLINPYATTLRITNLRILLPETALAIGELSDPLVGPGVFDVPGVFDLAPGGDLVLFFDGSDPDGPGGIPLLPLTDPGSILVSEFDAEFPGNSEAFPLTMRTQHVPEPGTLVILAMVAILALRKRR